MPPIFIFSEAVAGARNEQLVLIIKEMQRHRFGRRAKTLPEDQQLPQRKALYAWDDELHRALNGKADEHTVSVLLATMLDGFPRGMVPKRSNLCRISASSHWRQCSFAGNSRRRDHSNLAKGPILPTIAELQDEFDYARQGATNTRRVVAKTIALLDNAEEILMATGDIDSPKKAFPT
ncbi:MAG: hypothetical protein FJX45_19020 [Alphaproteobacteria bacterium]|nr:hypothetical protein [Alphaproteobacteria bacterium]MBM3654023.1 hypothetical protein [Alphaproteobacteria bacterium]